MIARDYVPSAYAARASAAMPFARGHVGYLAWSSVCTLMAPRRTMTLRFSIRAPGPVSRCMIVRWVGISDSVPTAPCDGTTVRGFIASKASNAASHALNARRLARGEERVVHHHVAGKEHAVAFDEDTGVPPGMRRSHHEHPHPDPAEIERVLTIERDVGLAARGVLQQFPVSGDRPEKVLIICRAAFREFGLLHRRVDVLRRGGKRQVPGGVLGMDSEWRRCTARCSC